MLALTTVPASPTGSPDHVAIIDTRLNDVVAFVPTPAGTHGVNWGAKLGGGYYAYVTSQHSNALTIIDPDPDGDGDGRDAAVVGRIVLANGSPGAGATDGTGGQGVKPLPMTHDGWIQKTVALSGTGALSPEVEGWLSLLTEEQRDPSHHHCVADLTGSSNPQHPDYGRPDGQVDVKDFFFFLDRFVAGDLLTVDLTGSANPDDPDYGRPDCVVDIKDFFYFLDHFAEGC